MCSSSRSPASTAMIRIRADSCSLSACEVVAVDDEKEESKLDFIIILIDSMGNSGQLKLSEIKSIIPPLQVQYLKLKDVNDDIYGNTWEAALDDVRIDLDRFGNEVDLTAIKQIEFRFDQTDKGKIFINEIGVEEN